jgi:hypothetical protein
MNLSFSYNVDADKAYIIRLKNNALSKKLAKTCANSCDAVGQPWQYWDAYDGIANPIKEPLHHGQVMNLIKVTDPYLTRGEVACALSHISLWARCVEQDQPLVVLEHDAVMLQPYKNHAVFNSICYLGNQEQYKAGWKILPTPPHATDGNNYHFICRAHAYAIDPAVAKNMLSHVIRYGINSSLDMLLRADVFPIHQIGLYAYDNPNINNGQIETTILQRPLTGRAVQHNDNLDL